MQTIALGELAGWVGVVHIHLPKRGGSDELRAFVELGDVAEELFFILAACMLPFAGRLGVFLMTTSSA